MESLVLQTSLLMINLLLSSAVADRPLLQYECPNLVPGVQHLQHGVDVSRLDLVYPGSGVDGFRSPVLNLTCTGKRTWTNKHVTYDRPDQVWYIRETPKGDETLDVQVYKARSDVKRYLHGITDFNRDTLWNFWFSASAIYVKVSQEILSTSKYFAQVSMRQLVSEVELIEGERLQLTSYAQNEVDKIQGSYREDPSGYISFIHSFGTHYITKAQLGGLFVTQFETKQCYYDTYGDKEARVNLEIGFRQLLSASLTPYDSRLAGVSEEFLNATTFRRFYLGGDVNMRQGDSLQVWQPTVQFDPWLLAVALSPISDLLEDEEKKKEMEVAVEQYLLRQRLMELKALMEARTMWRNPHSPRILHSQLSRMEASVLLNKKDITEVGIALGEEDPPSWFPASQICQRLGSADGCSKKPCMGTQCVRVNQTTYTDGTVKGSNRQWGIINSAHNLPQWFKQVQLCYRWEAEDGRCGTSLEYCAYVNSYTDDYNHSTDTRRGGCKMSWKVSLPEQAPAWIYGAELCLLQGSPQGKASGDPCSAVISSSPLCSPFDLWTEFYIDVSHWSCGVQFLLQYKSPSPEQKPDCQRKEMPAEQNKEPYFTAKMLAVLAFGLLALIAISCCMVFILRKC